MSYDGGPFELAQRRLGANAAGFASKPFFPHQGSSYWTPIPQGTTSVTFRFSEDQGYRGPFQAQDFGVWTLGVSGSSGS